MPWNNAKLAKAEKRGETKMIQCLKVTLYQFRANKTKKKRFTEDSYLAHVCVHFSRLWLSLSLLHFTISNISSNKRKRKEADYNFVHQHLWSLAVFNILRTLSIKILSEMRRWFRLRNTPTAAAANNNDNDTNCAEMFSTKPRRELTFFFFSCFLIEIFGSVKERWQTMRKVGWLVGW